MMDRSRKANFAMAFLSILIYSSLAITCFYFANKFWDRKSNSLRGGRYARPKFVFFVVLGSSALLDLPSFIGCVAHQGPSSCVWNETSYAFCWCCHLIAACGYSFAIITPSILWSDIVQQKDGNFWNSVSPLDPIKIFFRVCYVAYCAIILLTVVGVILFSRASDESEFSNSNSVGVISNCLQPIFLFLITLGCVWCGRSLQSYVRNVQLGTATQLKIIRKLNFTMVLIATTYGLRAMLVLTLYGEMPAAYQDAFAPLRYYPTWLLLTQWLPYIVCSYSLVNSMRFKEEDKNPAAGGGGSGGTALENSTSNTTAANTAANAATGVIAIPSGVHMDESGMYSFTSGHSHRVKRSATTMSVESGRSVGSVESGAGGGAVKSPFDHSLSNDMTSGAALTDSVAGETLDCLLASVVQQEGGGGTLSQKNNFFSHGSEGTGSQDMSESPYEGGGSTLMDHFFTANALLARSNKAALLKQNSSSGLGRSFL
jgi:hypothetical protein